MCNDNIYVETFRSDVYFKKLDNEQHFLKDMCKYAATNYCHVKTKPALYTYFVKDFAKLPLCNLIILNFTFKQTYVIL